MFELRVNIHSPLYAIYKQGLNRWEYPPTRTDIYSFLYKILKFYFQRFYKTTITHLLFAFVMWYSVYACLTTLFTELSNTSLDLILGTLTTFAIGSAALTFVLFVVIKQIKKWYKWIMSNKWYIELTYQFGKLWEGFVGLLTPTIKFVGHPINEDETRRFY